MRNATTLRGFGFDDIFDAVDDVFDEIKDVVGDVFDATVDKLGKAFPYLAAAGAFIVTGNPAAAAQGFRMGQQVYNAHEAEEAGDDAKREYKQAMAMGNYLASAGIDISGNDPGANELIEQLREDDYDYKSNEAQQLIADFIEERRQQQQTTTTAMLIGGGVLAAAGLYYVMGRRR